MNWEVRIVRGKEECPIINRYELVNRHNPVMKEIDPVFPLTVVNGELAFTADITGFQTFDYEYEKGMPLCTQS